MAQLWPGSGLLAAWATCPVTAWAAPDAWANPALMGEVASREVPLQEGNFVQPRVIQVILRREAAIAKHVSVCVCLQSVS